MPALSKVAKEDWQKAVIERAREAEQRKREYEAAETAWREAEAGYLDVATRAKDAGAPVAKLPFTATNGLDMTVTFVDGRGKNSHLDEAALAKRIGARKWKTITKTVIDSAKLKVAIEAGTITAADVALCTRPGDKKSYPLFAAVKTSVVKAVKRVAALASVN